MNETKSLTSTNSRVVAVIQARMGSERLPGKVLMKLAGQPALSWAVRRTARAQRVSEVAVATTTRSHDDPIEGLCRDLGIRCIRGSENDVLDRYHNAAKELSADVVVRLTGDDPLIDPAIVDRVIDEFFAGQDDIVYSSNVHQVRTFPRGQDTEVIRRDALERAWRDNHNPKFREHVTQYIVRNPDLFPSVCIRHDVDLSHWRWAMDTPDDYELLAKICDALPNDTVSWLEVVEMIKRNPEWLGINAHIQQKTIDD